jgi:hypothetical protein
MLTDWDEMNNLCRGPYIDASYQVSVYLAMQFQRRFFRNRPIRNKNCLWRPCMLTDRDEMDNLYRGPYIDVGRSDIFQFYLHNGKFCNSVLHLKTAAVTMH